MTPARPARRLGSFSLSLLLAAGLVALAACAGRSGPPGAAEAPPAEATASGPDRSSLHPGDALLLRVWQEPGMSDTLRVDEDGVVTFPLLGTRQVTGVPTDSLKRQVLADYGQYVKGEVELTLLRRVSVLGAVKQPGLYAVDLTYSLADVLARAGGVTPNADKEDVRLVRDGRVVHHSLRQTRTIASLPIRSGDQIVVGERSWLARNWQWLGGTIISASVLILTR